MGEVRLLCLVLFVRNSEKQHIVLNKNFIEMMIPKVCCSFSPVNGSVALILLLSVDDTRV